MHKTLLIVAALCLSPLAAHAKDVWTVGHGAGDGCWKAGGTSAGGAKFCHNCTSQGGKYVRWNFTLACDGKDTTKVAGVSLDCSGAEGNLAEGGGKPGKPDQHDTLAAKVALPAKGTACPK